MSMEKTSIDRTEARRRIDELEAAFKLGHQYARVERGTVMPDGKPETDGEHAISLAIIATAYAMKYHPELNHYEVFFYCVMHDIDEFKFGDTPTIGATEETFRVKDLEEAEAAVERSKILSAFPEFNALIDQLSDLKKPENAFGKGFDKLAPGYMHADNNGQALKETYGVYSLDDLLEATRATDEKMYKYAANFVDVLALRQEMHYKVAGESFNGPVWVDEPLFDLPI
jgi:5'-deoxynucleotidase YfbR-like HD superfamily hydrolase